MGDAVVIVASCRARVACPRCGQESARVHGGYARVVADSVAGGRPVLIVLQVRRFRCGNPACPAVTFAEQASGVSERYRRRSVPLLGMLGGFGLELAGRRPAGWNPRDRRAPRRCCAWSRRRRIRRSALRRRCSGLMTSRWLRAMCTGRCWWTCAPGTWWTCCRTGRLPRWRRWLRTHPGAGIICRDRADNYAEGARAGAPEAIQVADRWHLWHNLAEYAQKTVAAHRGCLKDHGGDAGGVATADTLEHEPAQRAEGGPLVPGWFLDACGRERRLVTRTRERYAEIHGRLDAGESLSAISRATGLDRKTVQRFARAGSAGELLGKATSRESKLDKFRPYLHQRWNAGVTDAAALHAELREQGWAGSKQTVRRYVRPFGRNAPPRTRLWRSRRPRRSPAGC